MPIHIQRDQPSQDVFSDRDTVAARGLGALTTFSEPDENAHDLRVAHLSQGHLLAENRPGSDTGESVDRTLITFVESFLQIPSNRSVKVRRAQLVAAERARFSGQQQHAPFPGAAVYWPYAYAVPALAVAIGRATNASQPRTFHLPRTFNALLGPALCAMDHRPCSLCRMGLNRGVPAAKCTAMPP
jgi:hypothetical protein